MPLATLRPLLRAHAAEPQQAGQPLAPLLRAMHQPTCCPNAACFVDCSAKERQQQTMGKRDTGRQPKHALGGSSEIKF